MTALELQPTRKVDEAFWLDDGELASTRDAVVRALQESSAEGTPPDVGGALMHSVLVALDELVEQRARAVGRTIPLKPWPTHPAPPTSHPVPSLGAEAPPLTGRVLRASRPMPAPLGGPADPSVLEVQLDGLADGTQIGGQDISIFPKGTGYHTVKVLSASVDEDRYQGSFSFRATVSFDLPPGTRKEEGLTLSRAVTGKTAALIFQAGSPALPGVLAAQLMRPQVITK